ncbi:MAG: hypothetical protein RI930_69 [Pseudomonadota bacterium]|jgi:hypothetical protein
MILLIQHKEQQILIKPEKIDLIYITSFGDEATLNIHADKVVNCFAGKYDEIVEILERVKSKIRYDYI